MHKSITLKAPAKINLTLDIVGKRNDGYHNLCSVMQAISIFDYITINKNDTKKINISCDKTGIPLDKSNIAYKACEEFFSFTNNFCGVDIDIKKHIPSGAGLAGGSADGAGVILGLDTIFDTSLSVDNLISISSKVGADVAFCLFGGTKLCEGIGDKLSSLSPLADCKILVAKPDVSISTPKAYKIYDEQNISISSSFSDMKHALDNSDLSCVGKNLSNALEIATDESIISELKEDMTRYGAYGSIMSGSGSSVFGIFDKNADLEKCYNEIKSKV